MSRFDKYLDPLYKEIGSLLDFQNISAQDEVEEYEYRYLISILSSLGDNYKEHKERLENLDQELEKYIYLIDNETGKDKEDAMSMYGKILGQIEQIVAQLTKELDMINAPYFGKIIFDRKASGIFTDSEITTYIGKFAYADYASAKPLITDWRAPVADLYYKNSGPTRNVEFKSPHGMQKGNLTQKRQFEIQRGRFTHIYDAKSGNVTADEFLLSQLNNRVGKKLKEIVATIQEQQNDIIREEINHPVIMQGVAGSGKTTILLHRLAYLFFSERDNVRAEKSLIIAPNKMFLDYISDVLPSLGISGVETNTYLFWAKKILNWDDRYVLASQEDLLSKEFKGSIEFKKIVEQYFEEYLKNLLENIPYTKKNVIKKRFKELKSNNELNILEALDLSLEYSFVQDELSGIQSTRLGGSEAREKKKKEIRQYFKKNTNPYNIYRQIFESNIPVDKKVSKISLSVLKGKRYALEDLAAIVWINIQLNGFKELQKEYVVVDEAQDLSTFELYTLSLVAKNKNLMLAGDLAQSIRPPFYIKDWTKLAKDLDLDEIYTYHQLHRSYRTTVEIVDYSNSVIKRFFPKGYKLPEAVLRHGDDVKEVSVSQKDLLPIVKELHEKGGITTAVICRDEKHANDVYIALSKKEDDDIKNHDDNDFQTGIIVIPILKAKGLEFDNVIIVDMDDINYKEGELESRLFYVACTRALHRLMITYSNKKSKLLENQNV
jgi:DNA helicase-2/ATP-dependent DNA helicase PcrA